MIQDNKKPRLASGFLCGERVGTQVGLYTRPFAGSIPRLSTTNLMGRVVGTAPGLTPGAVGFNTPALHQSKYRTD